MKIAYSLFLSLLLVCFMLPATAQTVDINTATAEELAATLDGVGPAKAAAIVEYRNSQGAFQSVDDLAKVKGIGDKTLEQNRSKITVGNATGSPSSSSPAAPPEEPKPPAATSSTATPPATKPSN